MHFARFEASPLFITKSGMIVKRMERMERIRTDFNPAYGVMGQN